MTQNSLILIVLVLTVCFWDWSSRIVLPQESVEKNNTQQLQALSINEPKLNDPEGKLLNLLALKSGQEQKSDSEEEKSMSMDQQSGKVKRIFDNDWQYKLQAIIFPSDKHNSLPAFALLLAENLKSQQRKVIQLNNGETFSGYKVNISDTNEIVFKGASNTVELVMYEKSMSHKGKS